MVYLLNMVIFHGYVKYPDGKLKIAMEWTWGKKTVDFEVHGAQEARYVQRNL